MSYELAIRRLLWLRHGCPSAALYGDDGEMQCAECLIDFRREPAQAIEERFELLARRKLAAQQAQANGGAAPEAKA